MKILQNKPRLVIKHFETVYKFLPEHEIIAEQNVERLRPYIERYNKYKNTNALAIKIPTATFSNFVIMTPYFQNPLNYEIEKIANVYETLSAFSEYFSNGSTSVSLGDFQVRNLFVDHEVVAIDLGVLAGKPVPLFYDRARFILNVLDSGYNGFASTLFLMTENKPALLTQLDHRAKYLIIKRIRGKRYFSAVYRYLCYLRWRLIQ